MLNRHWEILQVVSCPHQLSRPCLVYSIPPFQRVGLSLGTAWQVVETNVAGLFRVWAVLEDGSMQKITLEVPRIFYVNTRFRHQDKAASLKSGLARKLPFGKICYNLHEVAAACDADSAQSAAPAVSAGGRRGLASVEAASWQP